MKINTEAIGAVIVDALPFSSAFARANGRSIFLSKDAHPYNQEPDRPITRPNAFRPAIPNREYPHAEEGAWFHQVVHTLIDGLLLGLAGWAYLESAAKGDPILGAYAVGMFGLRMAYKGFIHGAARRIMHGQLGGE